MQAPPGPERLSQRRSPAADPQPPPPPPPSGVSSGNSVSSAHGAAGVRSSSASSRSQGVRRQNPSQQLSQIEKSVTHLLVATKQLLETLTLWSRQQSTEAEVSDVYVRLGYEFNIACRAFSTIGVDTSDLGPVPDLLRTILEDTLSQDASPQSLDKYLPRIRDIIINLLHGLKRKQARLRQRQQKDIPASATTRSDSVGSAGSGDTGLTQMLESVPSRVSSRPSVGRSGSREGIQTPEEYPVPQRTTSTATGRDSIIRADGYQTSSTDREAQPALPTSPSSSSMSSNTMQHLPVLTPAAYDESAVTSSSSKFATPMSAPNPSSKSNDALSILQRGGELERRASRRYSQYQISKHLGTPGTGVPMLPPSQNSPIPNRGRDVRESLNAVRTRSTLMHSRQRSSNRLAVDGSPNRVNNVPRKVSEETSQIRPVPSIFPPEAEPDFDSPTQKTPQDKIGHDYLNLEAASFPSAPAGNDLHGGDLPTSAVSEKQDAQGSKQGTTGIVQNGIRHEVSTPPPTQQFVPEQSPQPGKELTLFLQYKSKIKKFILPDGSNELSVARLQLAFIEKFAWNTHSNGIDLPEIYIQDPVSGVRHELEDLGDVKDRSVLVLNVEVLDEVKRHIDDGLGGIRRMVEGVRNVVDEQQLALQKVSGWQQDASKEMARLAAAPPLSSRVSQIGDSTPGGRSASVSTNSAAQLSEIQSLRRDLAVLRQTYSAFTSDIETSMSNIRAKAGNVKTVAIKAAVPELDGDSGRAYVNAGKEQLTDESEKIITKVDELQDIVEDLRKDVVSRGVRPLPRQLESVSKDISSATSDLKKMQEYLRREKPIWTKIWEKELEMVCTDRDMLTTHEDLAADLEDDLEKAAQTFALVEEATKQQMQAAPGVSLRPTNKGLNNIGMDPEVDPIKAKDGVLGEVKALRPNHEDRLEAIERAEKLRQKELESRRGGEFQKELGTFVEEGRLKKSGGVEEAERLRKAKDEKIRKEVWERQQAREREQEEIAAQADGDQPPEAEPALGEVQESDTGDDGSHVADQVADEAPQLPAPELDGESSELEGNGDGKANRGESDA